MKIRAVIIFGILIGVLVVILFYIQSSTQTLEYFKVKNFIAQAPKKSESQQLESEYGEFAEMTIPHLRSRSYLGSEIELKDVLSESATFTTHLASYKSDGLNINGLLTMPTTKIPKGGFPAIVFLHGYIQPDQYSTTQKYVDYVNYLARNGFVVYKIDLRGHGNSEGQPGGAYFSSNYIIDTLNAVASLKTLGSVNSEQIGLWGHSMSGNTVLRSMVVDPSIKAGVIWAGAVYSYTDFVEYRLNDRSFVRDRDIPSRFLRRSASLFETVGEISAENDFWKLVAPTNFLDDIKGGVQIHHAENDSVVSINYSLNLVKKLEESGATHQLYTYAQGGHNLESPSFSPAMARTVEFYLEQFSSNPLTE